jgi:hypothetical protein
MSNSNSLIRLNIPQNRIQPPINPNPERVLNGTSSKKAKVWIIVILVIIVIAGIATAISKYIQKEKEKAKLKWPDERCSNQLYMNYPGFFGPPGMTYSLNKAFCDAAAMNAVAKKNNAPLQNQLNIQNKTIGQFNNYIKKTNKMMYQFKKVTTEQIVKVRKDLADTFKRLAYTYKKFKGLFTDIFMVFYSTFNSVKYFIWTIIVWWKAPWGGGVLRFFSCFGEETLIYLKKRGLKRFVI